MGCFAQFMPGHIWPVRYTCLMSHEEINNRLPLRTDNIRCATRNSPWSCFNWRIVEEGATRGPGFGLTGESLKRALFRSHPTIAPSFILLCVVFHTAVLRAAGNWMAPMETSPHACSGGLSSCLFCLQFPPCW